jgi:hypothetical protein
MSVGTSAVSASDQKKQISKKIEAPLGNSAKLRRCPRREICRLAIGYNEQEQLVLDDINWTPLGAV